MTAGKGGKEFIRTWPFLPSKDYLLGAGNQALTSTGRKRPSLHSWKRSGPEELGSSNCFKHHHEGLREMSGSLLGTVKAVLREGGLGHHHSVPERHRRKCGSPTLRTPPSELKREIHTKVDERKGMLCPFSAILCHVGPGHGMGDQGRRDRFESGDARLTNEMLTTGE